MLTRRALVAAFVASLLAAGAAPQAQAAQTILFGGGAAGGIDTLAARRICALVNEHGGDAYACIARPTRASVFNIRAVAVGLMDFGLAQSDLSHEAFNGLGAWQGKPVEGLRSVFGLHHETVLLVTRADTGIAGVADLRGRTVNIGRPGSGPRGNAEDVLRLHGIDGNRDIETRSLKLERAARALALGTVDAFFCTVGNPAAALTEAAAASDIAIVPLDSESVRRFVAASPYYAMATLAPGTYRGVAAPVATYAVAATVVTGAAVAEDIVYGVTRAVFETLDGLRSAHPAFRDLQPAAMLEGLPAPLHPGAARYYRERGWL